MARYNFHEAFAGEQVKPPSERSTGLVFTAIAGLVAYHNRHHGAALAVSVLVTAGLFAASMLAPKLLRPLNMLWFRLSLLLNRIVTPVVMFLIFVLVFVPGGALMRIWRDPLAARHPKGSPTYWVERDGNGSKPASMVNQF